MGKERFLPLMALLVGLWAPSAHAWQFSSEFWRNDEDGWVVEAKPCDGGLCAFLIDYRMGDDHKPGYVPRDEHNPNPSLRAQPLCGLRLMGGFQPSKRTKGKWDSGWVYDPESGKTYSGSITEIDDGTVKLRGYIGIPLFGRSLTLHRVMAAPAGCMPVP
jgi:uncharacterized protein (DUF2147 family)